MSNDPFGNAGNTPYQQGNPYQTPSAAGYGGPSGPPPAGKVQGPAIGLMVVGGIGIAFGLLGLAINLLGVGLGAAAGANDGADGMNMVARGAGGIVGGIIGLAINGTILYGALQMKGLQNYGLAMAASILAILPCSCACIIGIPIGIWSLVTLNDPMVKNSFR